MVTIECDILVVGAGPAGSVAALYCSKQGLDTVLIEKNNKIGACTNTRIDSSPDFGLTEIINEMELKTENLVYNSKWYAPSGYSFTLHSKIGEYYFKRGPDPDSFECITVNKAIRNGCILFSSVTLESITKDGRKFDKVTLSNGEKMVIKPEIIIAADGEKSFFHRYFNKQFLKKECKAFGVTGKDFTRSDTSEIYFDAKLAPGGYFYIVTGSSGISSAGILLDPPKMKGSVERSFYDFLSNKSTIADTIKSCNEKFVGERHLFILNRHILDNLLLVGDAAGLVDPLMGYGMMPAILSGYYAGKYSTAAIRSGDYEVLKKYEREVKKRFNKRMSYLLRYIFDSLDNKDLDMLIKMAKELEERTEVDELLVQLSLSGLFHALSVFFKNLPNNRQLVAKCCKGVWETGYRHKN